MINKIKTKDIEDIISLTPMQRGILFNYLSDSDDDQYFEQLILNLSGYINVDHFQKAWNFVVEINQMLRTVFRWQKMKNPLQVILKRHSVGFRYYDLSNLAAEERERMLAETWKREIGHKYDLQQVSFKVALCKLEAERYRMLIIYHHILYDGWSTGIILKELMAAYNHLAAGVKPERPFKGDFKDYVRNLQQTDREQQVRFWTQYLASFKPGKEFLIKKVPRGLRQVLRYNLDLGAAFRENLDAFVKEYKVTAASVFYTAWGILMQKHKNCSDVVFGTAVSGRRNKVPGIENMVGLFINALPMRLNTQPEQIIGSVIHAVNRVMQEREEFESTSLTDILAYCGIKTKDELFDTIMVVENYPLEERLVDGSEHFRITGYDVVADLVKDFKMTVGIDLFHQEIKAVFAYDGGLFSDEVMAEMAQHLKTVVSEIIRQPQLALADIKMSKPQATDHQLLMEIEEKNKELDMSFDF